MNERTTLEIIAPTVEEALAQGLAQLGLPANAVSVEVLDAGNKGFLGLGGRQVRVRLTMNPPAGLVPIKETPPAPIAESAPPKREPKPPSVKEVEAKPEPVPASPERDHLLATTETIVSKLLAHLGFQAQVAAHYDEENSDDRRSIRVDVRGDDLSALIGRHAETLNAFQHIASLMVGKESQQWVQLSVDVEGYRGRREKQLRQLARRMAEQVIKTGRRAALEPMPSNERRFVHIELRSHPEVTTESTGEDPYRKVTILPKERKS